MASRHEHLLALQPEQTNSAIWPSPRNYFRRYVDWLTDTGKRAYDGIKTKNFHEAISSGGQALAGVYVGVKSAGAVGNGLGTLIKSLRTRVAKRYHK